MDHENDSILRAIVLNAVTPEEKGLDEITEIVLRTYHPSGADVQGINNGVVPASQLQHRIKTQLDTYLSRAGKIIVRITSHTGRRGRRKVYRLA